MELEDKYDYSEEKVSGRGYGRIRYELFKLKIYDGRDLQLWTDAVESVTGWLSENLLPNGEWR